MWVIHDGPPFASGKAHLGHLYNKTLKDIINRYKLMRGFRVHFLPGFDCHGTNIEDVAMAAETATGASKIGALDVSLKTTRGKKEEHMNQKEREAVKKRGMVREYVKRSALS
jgi:isoleucyl-tRNA synthetase